MGQVKEISLKLDLKNLQSPLVGDSPTDIPPLIPIKEENIETTIRMPNIPNSKRKASCNDNEPTSKQLKSERYRLIFGLNLFGFIIRIYHLRTSRIESPIPIRKQPARNRRDCGCQTDLELEPKEKPIEKNVMEQAREAAKIEFNKILEEERKQHQKWVNLLKKKQWCAMCLKEGMSRLCRIDQGFMFLCRKNLYS